MKLDQITEIPSWDDYFMSMAFLASTRSKDPNTKVGCVVAFSDRSFVTGYNGCPQNYADGLLKTSSKYDHVIHSEVNALSIAGLQRCRADKGTKLYVTIQPCPACMLQIINYGIKTVIYRNVYQSKTNNSKLLALMSNMGYDDKLCTEGIYIIKYDGPLIFEHSHMGIK